jgi:signal transduction histidine kinase
VIEDALDLTRFENNKFTVFRELFSIRAALEEVRDVMHFTLEQKDISLRLQIDPSVPPVIYSDQKRIKQVLFNLIGNAAKFTYNGAITVAMRFEAVAKRLVVNVRDTGIGMTEGDLAKLFRFFGQADSSKDINRNGMGLGLTISKMIVQSLGGVIDVKSTPGKGSDFFFSISLEEEAPEGSVIQMQAAPRSEEPQRTNHLQINQMLQLPRNNSNRLSSSPSRG